MQYVRAVGRYVFWWRRKPTPVVEMAQADLDAEARSKLKEWVQDMANDWDEAETRTLMAYISMHKRDTIDQCPVLARLVQDHLLHLAANDVFLREEFQDLFGYDLDKVMDERIFIIPTMPPVEKQEFLRLCKRYIDYNLVTLRGYPLNVRKVFVVQLANLVVENMELVRKHPIFYDTFRERMRAFEKEDLVLPWLEDYMQMQDIIMMQQQQ